MKINVILCDIFEDLMPFEDISYNSMIEDAFKSVNKNIKLEFFEAFARDLPEIIEEDDIFLIPGSRYEAYGDAPWLVELRHFIQDLHEQKAKMIGICFGHQVIAEALGGRVEKAVAGFGLGIREADLINPQHAMRFKNGKLSILNYHEDQVVIIPPEAELLAGSSFCPVEAYTVGKHIICTQGHPEYDTNYMKYLLKNHAKNVSEINKMKALKTLSKPSNSREIISYILDFLE